MVKAKKRARTQRPQKILGRLFIFRVFRGFWGRKEGFIKRALPRNTPGIFFFFLKVRGTHLPQNFLVFKNFFSNSLQLPYFFKNFFGIFNFRKEIKNKGFRVFTLKGRVSHGKPNFHFQSGGEIYKKNFLKPPGG